MAVSVKLWCYLLLVGAWLLDLVTPQLFVAAIFLNVPIALSSLSLDARLTRRLIVLALLASTGAAYVNAITEHHWDTIAVADRIVAGFSFFLVGTLSIAAQRSARRAGELAERAEREAREHHVRLAIERVRDSIDTASIESALVHEACASLGADLAWYYAGAPSLESATLYRSAHSEKDVVVEHVRPPAPIASFLQRACGEDQVLRRDASDPLGRLLLDTLGVTSLLAAPLVEHGVLFGILLIGRRTGTLPTDIEQSLRVYADQGAIALARGRLFEELARQNDVLKERSEVIRDIVYALSHDLRTPLTAANLTMRQAVEGRYGPMPDAYQEVLRRSILANEELRRLAETLLLVSRYESGEASTHRLRLDLKVLVQEVIHELEALWCGKEIALQVEGGEVVVLADRSELRRAVVNLIANAVTWTPVGGNVFVRIRACDGQGQLAVEDTGFGVPIDIRDRLFERLKGGTAHQGHGAGSGLGLYIVRRIAESHGGNVTYEERAEGGSIFTLQVPLAGERR